MFPLKLSTRHFGGTSRRSPLGLASVLLLLGVFLVACLLLHRKQHGLNAVLAREPVKIALAHQNALGDLRAVLNVPESHKLSPHHLPAGGPLLKSQEALSSKLAAQHQLAGDDQAGISSVPQSDTVNVDAGGIAVAPLARHPQSHKPVRAEIVTCPRCRLNSLPLVRQFVMEDSKLYGKELHVNFIVGKDPHLHLYEDEKEVADIDLSTYNRPQIIHRLAAFGIIPRDKTKEMEKLLADENVSLPSL